MIKKMVLSWEVVARYIGYKVRVAILQLICSDKMVNPSDDVLLFFAIGD